MITKRYPPLKDDQQEPREGCCPKMILPQASLVDETDYSEPLAMFAHDAATTVESRSHLMRHELERTIDTRFIHAS